MGMLDDLQESIEETTAAALDHRVDERFDPVKALAATVRYLRIARARLGRTDLAIAAYHMGIGNMQTALAA